MKNENKHGANCLTLPDIRGAMGENFQKFAADLFQTVYLLLFSFVGGGVVIGGYLSGKAVDSLVGRIARGRRG